jgi:hypothetical protein
MEHRIEYHERTTKSGGPSQPMVVIWEKLSLALVQVNAERLLDTYLMVTV